MPLNSHGIPKNLTDLSMLPDATNVALCPNLTPVAIAVWSLNEISSCHCLHRYTLYKWISKFTIYHFSCNGLVSSLRIFQISFLKILWCYTKCKLKIASEYKYKPDIRSRYTEVCSTLVKGQGPHLKQDVQSVFRNTESRVRRCKYKHV